MCIRDRKTVVYGIAIAGGLDTYLLLGQLMGGGMGMPRFEAAVVGNLEPVSYTHLERDASQALVAQYCR